jgi:hypothetical protein
LKAAPVQVKRMRACALLAFLACLAPAAGSALIGRVLVSLRSASLLPSYLRNARELVEMRLGKENNLIRDGEALEHHVQSAQQQPQQQQQQRAGKPVLCAQMHCKHVTANRLGMLLSTEHDSLAHVQLSRERQAS